MKGNRMPCAACGRMVEEVSTPDQHDSDCPIILEWAARDVKAALPPASAIKDVGDLIEWYLKAAGYDGLYNEHGECACEVGDCAPCGEGCEECLFGYKVPCDCGEHDYHIQSDKPEPEEEP